MIVSMTSKFCKNYLPVILWACCLFIVSSIPSSSIPTFRINNVDLLLHFIAYAILGFLLGNAFLFTREKVRLQFIVMACLAGIAYGASDEFHQMFVAGRSATVSDFIADSIGIMFGVLFFIQITKVFFWKSGKSS